jgi:hypothetical protein
MCVCVCVCVCVLCVLLLFVGVFFCEDVFLLNGMSHFGRRDFFGRKIVKVEVSEGFFDFFFFFDK